MAELDIKERQAGDVTVLDMSGKVTIGEGSVALNMRLLGTTTPPTNKAETFRLSIQDAQVLIAIIPGSRDASR